MRKKDAGKQLTRTQSINLETGEITYSQPRKTDMRFSDEKGYLYKHTDNYIKKFMDSPLPEELSWVDQGKLSRLQSYIIGSSQLLGKRENGRFKTLTIKDLAELFKCKERWVYSTLREAKKHHVLKEVVIDEVVWYAYNPIYGLKDKRITLETYLIFQDELKEVLPEWVQKNFTMQAATMPKKPIVK